MNAHATIHRAVSKPARPRGRPVLASIGSTARCGLQLVLAAVFLLWVGSGALAQQYPAKPVRLVVALAPGGGGDIVARVIAQQLSVRLGQPVVVENRVGGGGNIGAEHVAKSPPDGHTLFLVASNLAIAATLYKKLNFSPASDFTQIALIGTVPTLMVVSPGLPARDLKEFLALARSKPGGLSQASGGIGTSEHLAGEMLKAATGIQMVHVPYKGAAPAINDVIGGQASMMFTNQLSALPHVKSGKLRAIAIATAQRSAALSEVPTFAELGIPDFLVSIWWGLMGPSGMPRDVVMRLNQEVNAAIASPEIRERLAALSAEPLTGTPEMFAAFYAKEIRTWGDAVRKSGATEQ